MDQSGGDSHRIHLPHQGTDPFFIPEDIGEAGEFTPHIVVVDAQVIPAVLIFSYFWGIDGQQGVQDVS